MTNVDLQDQSCIEPELLRNLSDDQKARLTQQLDLYLQSLEQGEPLDTDRLAIEQPDIAQVFAVYLSKLDALYGIAVGFRNQGVTTTKYPIAPVAVMTLGDFTIEREIGRGGMGIVYEARQESLQRRVAIKLLPIAALLDSRQIARFKNEAHSAGLLQHPNIVPVYSVGSDHGVHYYAMQYIDGVSMDVPVQNDCASLQLKEYRESPVASMRRDAWRTIISWIIDIAGALQMAHENGVVHRDVKPSNLMLDKTGKIWITDFGLARCQTDLSLTRSGDVIGTMRYMSPEQARGRSTLIDGRADIYSLAVTLYEMLTLCPAHKGDDAPTILKMIDRGEITPLRQLRLDLPRDLETVIAKAMSKNREDRYDTAAEFACDLKRVLAGQPTLARPASIADRIGHLASKHRSAVMTGMLIVALGLVGLALASAKLAVAKQISDANAARALRGESLARDAVDRLGAQMAESLSDIPAADSVRRQLLLQTLDYYQRFAAEVKDDPALREDLAITLGKTGSLQSDLGDNDKAISSLARSESLYADLARQSADVSIELDWSISQNNLAQAFVRSGRLDDAASCFAQAMATQKRIITSNGGVEQQQLACVALATTLNNLGLLLTQTAANKEAEQIYLQAIALLTPETLERPKQARLQLAAVQSNLSALLTASSPERAVEYARQALSGQLDALQDDRGNAKLATKTIITLNSLGAAQSAANQNLAAIETFDRGIEIGKQLLARWPDQPTYRRDLVLSYNHLGLAMSKTGNREQARDAFDEALTLGRPLAELFVDDAETQSMFGSLLNNFGFLCEQLGDSESAAQAYRQAIEHQSDAVRLAPEVQRYREYLRKHQANIHGSGSQPARRHKEVVQPVMSSSRSKIARQETSS